MKHILTVLAWLCLLFPHLTYAQEISVTFRREKEAIDMSIRIPNDTSYALIQRDGITTITIGTSQNVNLENLKKALPKGFTIQNHINKPTSTVIQLATPGFRVDSHAREKHGILVEYVPDSSITVKAKAKPLPTPPVKPGATPAPPKDKIDTAALPSGRLTIEGTAKECRMVFSFPEERSMVSFLRDGYYWFVFNHPHPVEVHGTLLRTFGKLEQRLEPPMIIFELKRSPDMLINIDKEGKDWVVTMGENLDLDKDPIRKDLKGKLKYDETGKPIYEISADHNQIRYTFTDPRRGDRLELIPLAGDGRTFHSPVRFADFTVLRTRQGIAIQPNSPAVNVDLEPGLITIKRNDGLLVSSRHDRDSTIESQRSANHLDFPKWARSGADYIETRNQLEREIATAPQSKRIEAYYDLIRFNLARGFGVEALGLLRILSDDIPGLIHDPQFLALRAVGQFLANNPAMALHDMTSRELEDVQEIKIWKAATLNALKQTAAGTELFADNLPQIEQLPPFLKVKVALNGAMAALKENEQGLAEQLEAIISSTTIPSTLTKDYELLQALIAEKNQDLDKAETLLTELASQQDSRASALAELELIRKDLNSASIDLTEAIKKMEALRYSWRNSELEWRILKDLSQLYVDDHNYKKALSTMAVALKYHPDAPDYAELNTKMISTFKKLFSERNNPHVNPITAVSLYESFKNLTPPGPDGDEIVIGLAHNLERLDLPEQAAKALEARYNESDKTNPQLAIEYGIALLAANQSETALKVIEKTEKQKLGTEERGRLLYLKVKALANLHKYPEALKLIQGDSSDIAERMRAGLYWKAGQWQKAADSLWKLLDQQKDKDKDPDLLMSYTLMLYKAKNHARASEVKKRYSKIMKDTKHQKAFAILTSQDFKNDFSLDKLDIHLSQVDDFTELLNNEAL